MERSILREVLSTHLFDLDGDPVSSWKPAGPEMVEAWKNHLGLPFLTEPLRVSDTAMRSHAGDIVVVNEPHCVAKVLFHVEYGQDHVSLIKPFHKSGKNEFQLPAGDAVCIFVQTHGIRGAVAYKQLDMAKIMVAPQGFFAT